MKQLLLASQSPRRKYLLEQIGINPVVHSIEISEIINENMTIDEAIKTLAKEKCEAVLQSSIDLKKIDVILSADTLVVCEDDILGKPISEKMAISHLKALSGKRHSVVTAFCLYDVRRSLFYCDFDKTDVYFKSISDNEIKAYIFTKEPFGKAGAYAIQGLGQKFVKKIEGSWSNVVGLPIEKLEKVFLKNEWTFR